MSHRRGRSFLGSGFLVGHEGGRKGAPNWVPPCAKSLEQWTVERMKILKENQAKTQETSSHDFRCWLGFDFI